MSASSSSDTSPRTSRSCDVHARDNASQPIDAVVAELVSTV
ncbi:MAG: hypothetical protein ACXVR9_12910 [Gaiellaceae bacterium]